MFRSPDKAVSEDTLELLLRNAKGLRMDLGLRKNFRRFCGGVGQPIKEPK